MVSVGAASLPFLATPNNVQQTTSPHSRIDSMAILFKTTISETSAFEVIEQALISGRRYDGYFNAMSNAGETTLPWPPSASAEEFLAEVRNLLRMTWDASKEKLPGPLRR